MPRASTATRSSALRKALPAQQSRRRGPVVPSVPLGSLTQQPVAAQVACHACGGTQVTRLEMQLTDGTPVRFTSCHRCECRRWDHEGVELSVQTVLERTRKPA